MGPPRRVLQAMGHSAKSRSSNDIAPADPRTRHEMPGPICRPAPGGTRLTHRNRGISARPGVARFMRCHVASVARCTLRPSHALQEFRLSLFGALNTAVSGLSAQSAAFGNISDNVANSQTTGYKAVNTNFIDYLTTSTATNNQPGSVSALPSYTNSVQGTITQSSDPLALAISGQGFFAVSETAGVGTTGQPTFSAQTYYTQAGDFQMNDSAYLVNGAGQYLQGWTVNPQTNVADQSQLAPIQITQTQFNPVSTLNVALSANLPATPAANTPVSSQVNVYDALGNAHVLTLNWTQNSNNDWTVAVSSPDATTPAIGAAEVQF